jgi:hypothetical protein
MGLADDESRQLYLQIRRCRFEKIKTAPGDLGAVFIRYELMAVVRR